MLQEVNNFLNTLISEGGAHNNTISSYKYAINELGLNNSYKLEANTILSMNLDNYTFNYIYFLILLNTFVIWLVN